MTQAFRDPESSASTVAPSASEGTNGWGILGTMAGALGPFLPGVGNTLAGIAEGVGGVGTEATNSAGANPFGVAGGIAKTIGGVLSIPGVSEADDFLPGAFGIVGNVAGMITSGADAMNGEKSVADRVVAGADVAANAAGIGATLGGASLGSTVVAGAEGLVVAEAGTLGATSLLTAEAGAALTAGGALSAAAAGGVLAAGVGGYKMGGLINEAANSDYARRAGMGSSGDQTCAEYWLDTAAAMDDGSTLGAIAGGATAITMGTLGTIADAGGAALQWLTD